MATPFEKPGSALAKREPTNFEIALAEYEPQIAAVLPAHIPPERFRRVVITAVNLNPDLLKADRRSLFTACVRAAQDGLYPDGREAALVMFGDKATYMPMIHGIRKRMRNTGEVKSADAQVVHEKDEFSYQLGDDPHIHHKPAMGDRGNPIGAYAIIKLANGEIIREVMDVAAIERVRAVSRSKNNGPWVGWWSEMARKTVLRRASKAAPTSPEIDMLLRRDDDIELGAPVAQLPPPRPTRASVRVVEPEPEPEPETAPETIQGSASMPHDAETGEIEEGQEPASDIVMETADAMARETKTEQPPDPNAIPAGLYTVAAILTDGKVNWLATIARFKESVEKADTLEILDAVARDNWGDDRMLTILSAAKNKQRYEDLVVFLNARRGEIMAASPGDHA
jgi:recombination protein RecT